MNRRVQRVAAVVLGSASATFGWAAHAAVPEAWTACEKEVAKYCQKAADDEAIFSCIEKREHLGAKKSGLSKACNAAHEKYEAKSGKEHEEHESEEHHTEAE
jgi:hypothetical protein